MKLTAAAVWVGQAIKLFKNGPGKILSPGERTRVRAGVVTRQSGNSKPDCPLATAVFFLGASLIFSCASEGKADVIADWTFETSQPATAGPFSPEIGSGSASGSHSSGDYYYSSPAGNGSLHSFSSSHWTAGDYFQFSVSTVGFSQISVVFDQISSSTGPANFHFEYSTDGGVNFSTFADYTITHTAFTVSTTTYNENLGAMTGLDNNAGVVFRLADADSTSESGGMVGTGGTSKVDNFIVSGIAAVPEPAMWGTISALSLLGVCGLHEWRRQRAKSEILKSGA